MVATEPSGDGAVPGCLQRATASRHRGGRKLAEVDRGRLHAYLLHADLGEHKTIYFRWRAGCQIQPTTAPSRFRGIKVCKITVVGLDLQRRNIIFAQYLDCCTVVTWCESRPPLRFHAFLKSLNRKRFLYPRHEVKQRLFHLKPLSLQSRDLQNENRTRRVTSVPPTTSAIKEARFVTKRKNNPNHEPGDRFSSVAIDKSCYLLRMNARDDRAINS